MKSLVEFINEAIIVESEDKTITFDFTGIDNAEDTLKSLEEYSDIVTVEDNKVTIKVTADNVSKIGPAKDIIQQAVQIERDGTKSTNDEQYAQKVSSLEHKISELDNAIDEIENPDNEKDNKSDKKDDKKEEETE